MKIDRPDSPDAPPAEPRRAEFKQALAEHASKRPGVPHTSARPAATAVPAPKPGLVARASRASAARPVIQRAHAQQQAVRSADHAATSDRLKQTRHSHEAEASRLVQARIEPASSPLPVDDRVRALLAAELSREPPGVPRGNPPKDGPDAVNGPEARAMPLAIAAADSKPSPTEASTAKLEAVQALVERVELFLKSNRPGLALSLADGFAAEVRIERTGPGQVAVRIQGRDGPLGARTLARVRAQLAARGIGVSALEELRG